MQLEVGMILEGKVSGITGFGAFVDLPGNKTGMVHISEVAQSFVKEISEHLKEGQTVKVKVLSIGDGSKISLSIKQAMDGFKPASPAGAGRPPVSQRFDKPGDRRVKEQNSFETMMSKFKQSSDEKFSGMKKNSSPNRRGNSFGQK